MLANLEEQGSELIIALDSIQARAQPCMTYIFPLPEEVAQHYGFI